MKYQVVIRGKVQSKLFSSPIAAMREFGSSNIEKLVEVRDELTEKFRGADGKTMSTK